MLKYSNNKYSSISRKELETVCPELSRIFTMVLPFQDHSILQGARNEYEQDKLLAEGKSKLAYPRSKHNVGPGAGRTLSDAVDVAVYHPVFGKLIGTENQYARICKEFGITKSRAETWLYMEYARLNALVMYAAYLDDVTVRWGGDWNYVNGILDQTFDDLFHWEVLR